MIKKETYYEDEHVSLNRFRVDGGYLYVYDFRKPQTPNDTPHPQMCFVPDPPPLTKG
jgi:hypothetical protein